MGPAKARKDYPYLLLEFNKKFGSPQLSTISVVEGDDEAYYRPRVSAHLHDADELDFLVGDGKANVLRLYTHVSSNPEIYDSKEYAFFVDRDYDARPAEGNRCYVTNVHSIENYYASTRFLKNVLRTKFGLRSESDKLELEAILSLYRDWSQVLYRESLDFNAWLIWQTTEAKLPDGKAPVLNLNNVRLPQLFQIGFNGRSIAVRPIFTLVSASEIFPGAAPPDMTRIEEIKNQLRIDDFLSYFRGKFALEFLQIVLQLFRIDVQKNAPEIFSSPRRIRLAWSDAFLSEYSSYAETPTCLVGFLKAGLSSATVDRLGA